MAQPLQQRSVTRPVSATDQAITNALVTGTTTTQEFQSAIGMTPRGPGG
jgi:hypothetical protein